MSENIIETQNLTVYYGKQRGILDVNLTVKEGEVFGFLGPNGAGKTTTQRVLLDVFPPTSGTAKIFGYDCQKEGVKARNQIGYLPGELALFPAMRVGEFFKMYENLRGVNGSKGYWQELAERLTLDLSRRIGKLSRGNKQKVGVVTAFMSKPGLLILDEPTGGLDPLVQQTVLDLVREAKAAGSTVFFSSHILSEVQAVCDRVGIIRDGQLIEVLQVEELLSRRMNRLTLIFDVLPPIDLFEMDGVKVLKYNEQRVDMEVRDHLDQVLRIASQHQIRDIETHNLSLEEVFLAYYREKKGGNHV